MLVYIVYVYAVYIWEIDTPIASKHISFKSKY